MELNKTGGTSFPPPGWVTNYEAARMLCVGVETLTCATWWRPMLRACGKCVRHPNGGRCNVYPIDQIERIMRARVEAAEVRIPEGFVDRDGACAMFGLSRTGWKNWIRAGRVRLGETVSSRCGGKQKLYRLEDLWRLRDELFGDDKIYKRADSVYHVPPEFVRREQAWAEFGVGMSTWWRWEREGRITFGRRVPAGPKLYRVEDIRRLLDEYGKFSPPYADPHRPGVFRVPLSGRDIKRREAIIDAESLPLIEGQHCSWSTTTCGIGFVSLLSGDGGGTPLRRVIMGVSDNGLNVGHANGDPLDCRRVNLVVRTIAQRCYTQRKRANVAGKPTTSRFKGVYWETCTKKWRASIGMNGKSRRLGRFGDEIAAAAAYDDAARQWFGEHARLNFPDGVDAYLAARNETVHASMPAATREAARSLTT